MRQDTNVLWLEKGLQGLEWVDLSKYNNKGAMVGPVFKQDSIYFDGINDYVDCGNDSSLNITNDITIEAVMKVTHPSAWHIIASKRDTTPILYQFYITPSHELKFIHRNSSGNVDNFVSTDILTMNVWHHITFTITGTTLRFYIDGIEDTANPRTLVYPRTGVLGNLCIGAVMAANFLKGRISHFRIYNTGLSPDQVRESYEQTYRLV